MQYCEEYILIKLIYWFVFAIATTKYRGYSKEGCTVHVNKIVQYRSRETYHRLARRVSFLAGRVSFLASALQVPYKRFTFC